MKKMFWIIVAAAIVAACGDKPSPTPEGGDGPKPVTPDNPEYINLVANWNFEDDVDLNLADPAVGKWSWRAGWDAQGKQGAVAEPYQDDRRGLNNSRCLAIISPNVNVDVGFAQVIKGLKPGEPYKAIARIRTEDVTGGAGAHLSLDYLWAPRSNPITGTHSEYSTSVLEFEPEGEEVTLMLKLGNTAADSRGVAYFDNVTLTYNYDLYQRLSPKEHIKLIIDKKYLSVSDKVIDEWLAKMDLVYESYVEQFLGKKPYDGATIKIRSGVIGAWAYAGNPIQWNQNYIEQTLLQIAEGDWCFGLMHELGHDFNPGHMKGEYDQCPWQAWDFNEELFANFRMYYALSHVPGAQIIQDAKIYQPDGTFVTQKKVYKGTEIKQMYKSETDNGYDQTIAKNKAVEMGNGLTYCMVRIVDAFGWEIWQKTYDDLYRLPATAVNPAGWNQWQKFTYLMEALDKNAPAGRSVYDTFSTQELKVIESYLSTQK